MSRVQEIVDLLITARDAYYNGGGAILEDEEYDILEDELRNLAPDHELLKKVGSTPTSNWEKVKHIIPMGSLSKVQDNDQWSKWASKLPKLADTMQTIIMTEKLDGISIAVEFHNGNVVRALTRGDGIIGEDITKNFVKMKNTRQGMTYRPFNGWLRGEIVLRKSDWQKHMSDKKNPRNAASGTAKRLDGEGCEHLTVMFYDMFVGNESKEMRGFTKHEMLGFIKHDLHLDVPNCIGPLTPGEVPDIVKAWEENRGELDYLIDGMVVEINDRNVFFDMGEIDQRPKGAVAYKFPAEKKPTTVTGITWQVGLTGRVTPVAELEPVDIGGVTIKRVSLHTARIALDSKAGPGSRVIISRRNDVIPYVESVLASASDVPMPDFPCTWEGEYLVTEVDSKVKLYNAIKVWVQRLRILHWGDSFINKLIDSEYVTALPDIYRIDWTTVGNKMGEGIAARAAKSIRTSGVEMTMESFISALNIRHCDSAAKDLVRQGVTSIPALLKLTYDDLVKMDGLGPTKADAIAKGITELKDVIDVLSTHIHIKEKSGGLVGQSFCFTGTMQTPRKELEAMVVDAGGDIKKSVGKGLTYLVIADPNSTSTKAQKARKLGTDLISEEQFLGMI